MHYEIRPGWNKPIERFEPQQDYDFARRWRQVRHLEASGCWRIYDGTTVPEAVGVTKVIGTKRPGDDVHQHYICRCQDCRKEFVAPEPDALFCFGCELVDTVHEPMVRAKPVAPVPRLAAVGYHVAGPYDHGQQLQFCARCGGLLSASKPEWPRVVPATLYPEGAIVERGATWQAMSLTQARPTCEELS